MTMQEAIISVIDSHLGVKDKDLILNVMGMINPSRFDKDEYERELGLLLRKNEIVQVKYAIPYIDDIRFIYLPKGSVVI